MGAEAQLLPAVANAAGGDLVEVGMSIGVDTIACPFDPAGFFAGTSQTLPRTERFRYVLADGLNVEYVYGMAKSSA